LAATPPEFTLYGGIAIALRLGHRPSIDFDWFASEPFAPYELMERVPYLKGSAVRQSSPDTLTITLDRGGPVQVSFFGGIDLGQVAEADIAAGPQFKVGSPIDLAGFKAAVVTQRAELRDYIDVHALMTKANIPLAEMLAAASIIYGDQFSPLLALKALAYHDDTALRELPANVRRDLTAAVAATDLRRLPVLHAVRMKAASR
jgi:Nucleotidyl transferase AbiEii toxin, Type IV TA system